MWKTMSAGSTRVEPAIKQFLPPCQVRCPINEDIQRTNVLISLLPEDPESATNGIIQIGDQHAKDLMPKYGLQFFQLQRWG